MKRTWMAAAAFALAAFANSQVDGNKVIATVNGEQILGSEYYHRMEFLPGVSRNFGNQSVVSTPGFFTITELIGERLVYQLAKQKGALPTSQEIDAELQARLSANPKYIEDQAQQGVTEADLKDSIKYDLAKFKLQTYGITVTDQEVKDHYQKNPADYTTPKQVHVRVIAVRTDNDASEVDSDLKSGKSFPEVAKARSIDTTQALGGEIGTLPINYFAPPVQSALSQIKIGQTTSWIPQGSGASAAKAKYQLVDVKPAQLMPLDKFLMISIRRNLMIEKSQGRNDVAKEIDEMRAKSKVTISEKQLQDLYDSYIAGNG